MLAGSSPNGVTITKGGVTMRVPNSDIEARVAALEEYVDMPEERTGMTVTARLDAQHNLLVAFRAEFTEFRDQTNRRLTALEQRIGVLEQRIGVLEDMIGQVLYGMTEIKRLLAV
jgi:hypothetical protein